MHNVRLLLPSLHCHLIRSTTGPSANSISVRITFTENHIFFGVFFLLLSSSSSFFSVYFCCLFTIAKQILYHSHTHVPISVQHKCVVLECESVFVCALFSNTFFSYQIPCFCSMELLHFKYVCVCESLFSLLSIRHKARKHGS